jgi:hypothetical protein
LNGEEEKAQMELSTAMARNKMVKEIGVELKARIAAGKAVRDVVWCQRIGPWPGGF